MEEVSKARGCVELGWAGCRRALGGALIDGRASSVDGEVQVVVERLRRTGRR